ncbi:Pex19 protein [Pisolithus microcarpus]|nr:Pex19 protein [Pisolithus microcarpus]
MESLMRELAENGGLDFDARDDVGRDPAISAAWEAMLVEEMDKMPGAAPASTSTSTASATQQKGSSPTPSTSKVGPNKPSAAATGDEFQSRIRDTMDKLKSSESGCKPSTAPLPTFPGADDPSLAAFLQGLETMEPKDGDELTGVLEAMMGQLMSKEVLYEPLKELDEKFPSYLASHTTLPAEEKERYEKQRSSITRLLAIFEEKNYNDEDAKTREKIAEVMGELQSYGSPPEEIMGPLPPGIAMGADGLPELPERCVVV